MKKVAFGFFSVCAASVLVTWLFLSLLPDSLRAIQGTDYARVYEPPARNLLSGKGFVGKDGLPETGIPPGFPIFLTAAFATASALETSETLVLTAASMAFAGLTAGHIYLLSRTFWACRVAWLPPLLWMTYPLALWLARGKQTEIPFMVAFVASIYVFVNILLAIEARAWQCLVAGALAGIAMLIRPIAIGLGLVEASLLLLLRRKRPLRRTLTLSLLLMAGNVITVLPWEIWLYSVTGQAILLSKGGRGAIRDGLTFATGGNAHHAASVPADVRDLMGTVQSAYQRRRSIVALADVLREEIFRRPVTVFKLFGLKVVRTWFGTDSGRFEGLIKIVQAIYLLAAVASTVACWRLGGRFRVLAAVAWSLVLYFWIMTFIAMSIVRYMVPPMALLFLLFPALFTGLSLQRGSQNV